MLVQLVLDNEGGISIPLDDCTREAWALQCDRAMHSGKLEGLQERVALCFAVSLSECLDSDLKPPTAAQLKFATDISRVLGIALPSEALRYRGAMTDFIQRFAEVLRSKRRNYPAVGS